MLNLNDSLRVINQHLANKQYSQAYEALLNAQRDYPESRELDDISFILNPKWTETVYGVNCRLRIPNQRDLDFFKTCFNDKAFMDRFHPLAPRYRSDNKLKNVLAACRRYPVASSKAVHWVIEQKVRSAVASHSEADQWEPVGLASVVDIQIYHRRAEFLMGIQDKKKQGSNIALSAALLALDFSFNHLKLQKVTSIVLANNPLSQKSTLSLGFTQEGHKRQHFRVPNSQQWLDSYENGLLKADFKINKRIARLSLKLLKRDITLEK